MILTLRDLLICHKQNHIFFFFFGGGRNSLAVSLSQYHPANTLTHKPLLHFEEKKLRQQKANEGRGVRTEEEEDGRAQMKSSGRGGGVGHSLPKQL